MKPVVQTQESFDSVSAATNQKQPVAVIQAPVAFSGRRQRATRPAATKVRPATTANAAISHGSGSWWLVKTSATAAAASATANAGRDAEPQHPHRRLTQAAS